MRVLELCDRQKRGYFIINMTFGKKRKKINTNHSARSIEMSRESGVMSWQLNSWQVYNFQEPREELIEVYRKIWFSDLL